jgi:hypothetical protein
MSRMSKRRLSDLADAPMPARAGMGASAKSLSRRFDIRDITGQWIEMYQAAIMG